MSFYTRFKPPAMTASECWERRRDRRENRRQLKGYRLRVEQIADHDNLFFVGKRLQEEGGQGAGVDGVHPGDVSGPELGVMCREVARQILSGKYLPSPVRQVPIPKPGTTECRILSIPTFIDRVVARAVLEAWQPFWEQRFRQCSYGFRPGRSPLHLLADLIVTVEHYGWTALGVADVRKAFDNVPIKPVLDLHRERLDDYRVKNFAQADRERSLRLVETVLRGAEPERQVGLQQGNPYSPAALNVLLDHYLDQQILQSYPCKLRWFRYADNMVVASQRMTGARCALEATNGLLAPLAMTLKPEPKVLDLSDGEAADILGLSLHLVDRELDLGLTDQAYERLALTLQDCHTETNPPLAARQRVMGWITGFGPGIGDDDLTTALGVTAEHGYREISLVDARWCLSRATKRWRRLLDAAYGRLRRTGPTRLRAAAPPRHFPAC